MSTRIATDMLGRSMELPVRPQRIVSLVPSQTELLYDLGLDSEVAGITKFCVHPESWFRSKTRIGGTKTVDADKVAALRPDLILANKEENVKEQIEALERIAPVWVSDIHDLAGALQMIAAIAELTDSGKEGRDLVATITAGFKHIQPIAPLTVAYGIWRKPWMWAGGDTFITDMLRHIGLRNALQDQLRYPEMDLAALAMFRPDVVLLSSEPYPFKEKHIAEVREALPDARIRLVDGEIFSWYGSRLALAPAYFKWLLPQLS